MKRLNSLRQRKGFTLVECVIAIAVFAVLTSMVVMIVGNAVELSKTSEDSEADLSGLVNNVVQDNSKAVYGGNSETLEMHFGTSSDVNFRMTYSTVDGYKNSIRCKNCKKVFNNLEYMSYLYSTTQYQSASDAEKKYKISYWFSKDLTDSTRNYFQCPDCEAKMYMSDITMRCLDCNSEHALNQYNGGTLFFELNSYTGNYRCNLCGSENVGQIETKADGTTDYVANQLTSETAFMLSSMKANALRYGYVEQLEEKADVKKLLVMEDKTGTENTALKCSVDFSYAPNASLSKPGIYTMSISGVSGITGSNQPATIKVTLPGSYVASLVSDPSHPNDGTGNNVNVIVTPSSNYAKSDKTSLITISNVTTTNCNSIVVKFTLENYANKNNFEDDYTQECKEADGAEPSVALARYWYEVTKGGTGFNYPREDASIVKLS